MVELKYESMSIPTADLGGEACIPDLLGEFILQNHLQFSLDEKDEIYEGYGIRKNAYPYRQLNQYTRELVNQEVRTIVLENSYLKAVFLADYGGRLWQLWDKSTGENLLYTNDVLRFSNLAIRNAWFSGGVEWNIGIIGHTPYTTNPLYVAELKTPTGLPVLRMYEYERVRQVYYQMDFWLEEEGSFLNCRVRIVNEGKEVVPMYWWSNIAIPEYEGGRVIVPADKAYTNSAGMVYKVDIPKVEGIDITDYNKIPYSVDYFFDIDRDKIKYIANVNKHGYGLLQVSTSRLQGRKLFSWGHVQGSDHWQAFLTEKAGRYLEIQAGLAKTQYGCIPMAPNTAWEWLEQYGAVSLSSDICQKSHTQRADYLTEELAQNMTWQRLEKKLKQTEALAKQSAKPIYTGSAYGAMQEQKKLSKHLEFCGLTDSLRKWQSFFETGILHQPSPNEVPDEFMIDRHNLDFLLKSLKDANQDNWYAFYHAGIGCFLVEQYEAAEQHFMMSWKLCENVWACHGLACVYTVLKREEEAAKWTCQGLKLATGGVSYLKESFRILYTIGAYQQTIAEYQKLSPQEQNIAKIRFYYIFALHKTGQSEKALALLEENGGLVIDDLRECEVSVGQLWLDLQETVYGKTMPVPYRFDFDTGKGAK